MRASRRLQGSCFGKTVLFVRIWTFASILPLLVRFFSLPRLIRVCTAGARGRPPDADLVVACTDTVLRRRLWNRGGPCLTRSLTLYRFLGGDAADLEICFGIRYEGDPPPDRRAPRLLGHAWLVRNGQLYLERDDQQTRRFRVVYRYPAREPQPT